jgi:alpha-tubulin suppressor-like RCC1 family protein
MSFSRAWFSCLLLVGCACPSQPSPPPRVAGPAQAIPVSLSLGDDSSCAVMSDGSVRCWGKLALGDGSVRALHSVPSRLALPGRATSISLGSRHVCAIVDGRVLCWGQSIYGALGDGTTDTRLCPAAVPGVQDAVQIAAGGMHSCARRRDGSVWCWGANDHGQLGDGSTKHRSVPAQVAVGNSVDIELGTRHSCAIDDAHSLWCWGDNARGQTLDGESADSLVATRVFGPGMVAEVGLHGNRTCVRGASGLVTCNEPRPVGVADLAADTAVQLAVGDDFTCARTRFGAVRCWGRGTEGELGDGANEIRERSTEVRGIHLASQVAAGARHACALTSEGEVYCWGEGVRGQLGDGKVANSSIPVRVDLRLTE